MHIIMYRYQFPGDTSRCSHNELSQIINKRYTKHIVLNCQTYNNGLSQILRKLQIKLFRTHTLYSTTHIVIFLHFKFLYYTFHIISQFNAYNYGIHLLEIRHVVHTMNYHISYTNFKSNSFEHIHNIWHTYSHISKKILLNCNILFVYFYIIRFI